MAGKIPPATEEEPNNDNAKNTNNDKMNLHPIKIIII